MPKLTCLLLCLAACAALADTPAYVLQLPATVTTVLVAETETATLYRYAHKQGRLELAATGYMSIGENGAGKERAWDRRTPLGLYFINDRLDTARMHDRYGPMAFPLATASGCTALTRPAAGGPRSTPTVASPCPTTTWSRLSPTCRSCRRRLS